MLSLALALGSGCGVRQFNAKEPGKPGELPKGSEIFAAFGPFHSSGQGGSAMVTGNCGSAGTRPCLKARASVGLPYQFDKNTVSGANAAVVLPAPPLGGTSHTTVAGAGKTKVASGPHAPNHPRVENRDLSNIKRQSAAGEQTF